MNLHRHFHEPAWRNPGQPFSSVPPVKLHGWLLDGSSLTRRLQALCKENFHVEVVSERRERPHVSEAAQLAISPQKMARVREVYLCCGERKWVFARTVIPFSSLSGPNRRLTRLGTKPLGAYLFAQPRLRRGPLQVARLPSFRGGREVFGRRSLFFLHGSALLVSEFFLPEFLEALDP